MGHLVRLGLGYKKGGMTLPSLTSCRGLTDTRTSYRRNLPKAVGYKNSLYLHSCALGATAGGRRASLGWEV
nr:MAG TPA: hypothetical protein [Caudoviricetes sp.]